jgi:hypothetical protein
MLNWFKRKPKPAAAATLPEPIARYAVRGGTESITLNALDMELVAHLNRRAAAAGVPLSVFCKNLLLQGLAANEASLNAGIWKAFKLLSEPRETF